MNALTETEEMIVERWTQLFLSIWAEELRCLDATGDDKPVPLPQWYLDALAEDDDE